MNLDARFAHELTSFGERVKEVRTRKKLTQPNLGALANMRVSNISRIEKGSTNLKLATIIRLADAFKVTLSTLFDEKGGKIIHIRKKYKVAEERFEDEKKRMGLRIEGLTKHRNLKQDELAILAKIDAADISRYINGDGNIEFFNIVKIAHALEVELIDIFNYNGTFPDNKRFKGRL
ncbi:MAG TPA: helix-turn-helix transcriptional regulator [Chitinophagaceae bacterium]